MDVVSTIPTSDIAAISSSVTPARILKALEEDAKDQRVVLDEALVILGDLPALWTSLDGDGKQAWVQVLLQKLVINDRGKVVDRALNHPFDEIEFKNGRFEQCSVK